MIANKTIGAVLSSVHQHDPTVVSVGIYLRQHFFITIFAKVSRHIYIFKALISVTEPTTVGHP